MSLSDALNGATEQLESVEMALQKEDLLTVSDIEDYICRICLTLESLHKCKPHSKSNRKLVHAYISSLCCANASLMLTSYKKRKDVPGNEDQSWYTDAVILCVRALSIRPDYIEAYLTRYKLQLTANKPTLAIKDLQKALHIAKSQQSPIELSIRKTLVNEYSQYMLKGVWSQCLTSGRKASARCFPSFTQVGKLLYMFGGQCGQLEFCSTYYNDLFTFNLETREWKCLHNGCGKTAPQKSSGALIWFYEGCLYLHGGQCHITTYDQLCCFNLQKKTWSAVTAKGRLTRHYHGGCLHNNRFYVFGGFSETKETNALNFLDMKALKWMRIKFPAASPVPAARFEYAFWHSPNDGVLYVYGGNPGTSDDNVLQSRSLENEYFLWSFDLDSHTWSHKDVRHMAGIYHLPVMEFTACTNHESLNAAGSDRKSCDTFLFGGYSDKEKTYYIGKESKAMSCLCNMYFNDLVIFRNNKWYYVETTGQIPSERAGIVVAEWQGKFYALLGYTTLKDDKSGFNDVPLHFNDVYCCVVEDKEKKVDFYCSSKSCEKQEDRQSGCKFLLCSSCKKVRYCSRSCQSDHWRKEHRTACKKATC